MNFPPLHDAPNVDDDAWDELAPGEASAPASPLLVACPWAPTFPAIASAFPAMAWSNKPDFFPAIAARSALFGARGKSGARHAVELQAQGEFRIFFQGEPLGMTDKQIWEVAMSMAKQSPDLQCELAVSLSGFGDAMGTRDRGSDALARIWASLERLSRCHLDLKFPDGRECAGFMLASARREGRRKWIAADPALAGPLFAWGSQFRIQTDRRSTLGSALARWLHDFLSTHKASSRPLTVGYLRGLSGFGGHRADFPAKLDAALAELASKAPGLLTGHAMPKSSRNSDRWELRLARGQEKANFVGYEAVATAAPIAQAKARPTKRWLVL